MAATNRATIQPPPMSQKGSPNPQGSTPVKENQMEITQKLMMKVSFPAVDTNKVNATLLLQQMLPFLKAVDDTILILPADNQEKTHHPIHQVSEVPTNGNIAFYVKDVQLDPIKRQMQLFITVFTSVRPMAQRKEDLAVPPPTLLTHYTQAIGVITMLHRHTRHAVISLTKLPQRDEWYWIST